MKRRSNISTEARIPALRAGALLLSLGLALAGCRFISGEDSIDSVLTPTAEEQAGSVEEALPDAPRVTFDGLRKNDPQARIGAAQHPKILKNFGGAYEDDRLEQVLALITGDLIAQSDDAGRAYDITVLDSPTVNAFALPGGYLYITRGLLALANDAAEVAAVLAHEMAHVSSNHGVKRSRETRAVNIAERVANDVVTNPVVGQVAKASTSQRLASFSQRQELQADAVGIKMLGRAGYDTFAAARFLESMERFARWRSAFTEGANDMSSTHPSTPQRVELARRHARAAAAPGDGKRNRDRYLEGIEGLVFGDKVDEGFVRGSDFYHKKLAIGFSVPDGFELTNRAKAVLASGPNQQALRFDAVPVKGESADPVAYLKSGWVNGLDEASVKPMRVNGLMGAAGTAAAGDWQFSVSVVKLGERYYRFILAAPRAQRGVAQTGARITGTFRKLSKREAANLKPLTISIATVRPGDTVDGLAGRMNGVARKRDLFLALNELPEDAKLEPGSRVKLVR